MVPIKSLYFVSGSERIEQGEKYSGLYKSLSSSGHNSAYFDKLHLKLSMPDYFEVHFHPIL